MPSAMFFAGNFYRFRGREINFWRLPNSMCIILITAIPSSFQFVFPEIIKLLERDKEALLSGEIWRLLTPLFVQPMGIWQCIFNGLFLFTFLPLAEHLYRRRVLIIYFVAGLTGQIFNYYWNKGGGGSSTAIYGVMGALLMYIVFHRNEFPRAYIFLPIAGFLGAIILCFFQDGHAPALLAGGILSLAFQGNKHGLKMA
jgi:membrane associated rhomboid family serine protease